MPKLKVEKRTKNNAYIKATIKKYIELTGIGMGELAMACRVCEATYYNRFRNLDKLTLGELRATADKLHIPTAELVEYIF